MSHSYRLGSCKLLSDIDLPELAPWEGASEGTDILQFTLGSANSTTDKRRYVIPGPPKVVIDDGIRVTIERSADEDLVEIRALLMGPIQAVLWHQRGLLPLHASAIAVGGKAVAIGGPSGAGKSTFAAVLASAGHVVLADDIAIVDPTSTTVLTGQRRLRLWRSALEYLGLPVNGLPRAMSRSEKFILKTDYVATPEHHPLAHVVLLNRRNDESIEVEQLHGSDATLAVTSIVQMLPVAHELGLGKAAFQSVIQLQKSGVCIWRLSLPDNLASIEAAAAILLAKLDA